MFVLICCIHSGRWYYLLNILNVVYRNHLVFYQQEYIFYDDVVLFFSGIRKNFTDYGYSCTYTTRDGYHNKSNSGNT